VAEVVRGYRNLVAWQKALDLADRVYDVTETWPAREMYGLTNQARRAATSIPANIAEGQGRESLGDFGRFLTIAYGSLCELETHLFLAQRRGFIEQETLGHLTDQSDEVARLIRGLLKSVRSRGGTAVRESEVSYNSSTEEDAV
jgi:four helix bundle protein